MSLSDLKSQLATNKPAITDPNKSKIEVKVAPTPTPKVEEKTYQTYKSGLENTKIIMQSGKVIHVRAHKYITCDAAEIEFLDNEIETGFPYLKKGEPVTTSDLDPMSALRKKIRAEVMAEIDAGNSETQKVVPASSKDLNMLSGNSNSSAAE